jgi:outer membrane protein TolC
MAAFYYHPSLEVARAEWAVAQGGIKTAAERPNPSVTVVPSYDNGISGSFSPWLPLINFDVPLETAGKRRRRMEQAQFLSQSARFDIATTAWEVRSALRVSLLDFVAARQRAELLGRQDALQREIIQRLESQAQAGAIGREEITVARVSLAKLAVELGNARSDEAQARARVAESIGMPASALDGVSLDFDLAHAHGAADLTSAAVRRMALRGRSDILAALADYAASQSALQLEIAKQYPDVHLSPGYQWNQGSENDNLWQLGLTVDLPVLNQNQGPIAEAEARRAAAAAKFVALQARIIGEIDRVTALYEASRTNLAALESLAAAQQAQYETVQAQFQAGAVDRLDLLNSELEFSATKVGELDAQAKLQQAIGSLEDAVQRPIELPEVIFRTEGTAAR